MSKLDALVSRIQRHLELSQSVLISDSLDRSKLDIKSISQFVSSVNDSVDRVVSAREPQDISRIISETLAITETLQAYKNDEQLIAPLPPALPEVPNLIGTRERAIRFPRRAPRPIVIDEVVNVAIAALKLLAFSDSNNKAIVGIKPRPTPNVVLSTMILARSQMSLARCSIKTQPQPMILKARLQLSLPLSSLYLTTAKLRLRPQPQSIHAVKAVNFEKMHKLTRIMKIAMLLD